MAMAKLSWLLPVALMLSGNASAVNFEARVRPLLASAVTSFSIELRGVEFKSGRPIKGEGLAASMKIPVGASYQLLDEATDMLKRSPEIVISVDGYANDEEGSIGERIVLSERRAKLVYDYLIAHGVPTNQLKEWKGHGSSSPIDSNETEEGRQRNSRVELTMQ
ncbi:MAG: OmpA family protein [Proteobacteria bacterium]|nr:OmpA family protein [Pseudomonadota bacterium]